MFLGFAIIFFPAKTTVSAPIIIPEFNLDATSLAFLSAFFLTKFAQPLFRDPFYFA